MAIQEVVAVVKKLDEALTPGPIEQFRNWHSERFEARIKDMSPEKLKIADARYKRSEPLNTLVISFLGCVAVIGVSQLAQKHEIIAAYPLETVALLDLAILNIFVVGPVRGKLRIEEGRLITEELKRRGP